MGFLGLHDPFFRPLWRRIAVVVFCTLWALVEFFYVSQTWAMFVGAIGAVAAWNFFVVPFPEESAADGDEDSGDG